MIEVVKKQYKKEGKMIELSPDQEQCLDAIVEWNKSGKPMFVMGGLAGTGKTTLIKHYRDTMKAFERVAFCTLTGKASSVLRKKLGEVSTNDYCGTIHGLIYNPVFDEKTHEIIDWVRRDRIDYDLIIIDEASMLSEELLADLKSYNIKMLCVGDHGQLPPIEGKLNLMEQTDIRLEKIHRTCEGNPIIQLSMRVRDGEIIKNGVYGDKVRKVESKDPAVEQFLIDLEKNQADNIVLCGFNKDRVEFNRRVRKIRGLSSIYPKTGERVICLKNNKHANVPIYNGVLGEVVFCEEVRNHLEFAIDLDGDSQYMGRVSRKIFENPEWKDRYERVKINKRTVIIDYFDYGYCLTCHKAQGSEWPNVMVKEQRCSAWEHSRWLYTAITRSSDKLLWVV